MEKMLEYRGLQLGYPWTMHTTSLRCEFAINTLSVAPRPGCMARTPICKQDGTVKNFRKGK